MSSAEPNDGGDEIDGGQEVAGGFVIATGDGAELLEFGEKVFDQVARFVEFPIIRGRILAVATGRNHIALARLFNLK